MDINMQIDKHEYAYTPVCVGTSNRHLLVSELLSYKMRNQVAFNCFYITAHGTQHNISESHNINA